MRITSNQEMIFRKERNGIPSYVVGISNKNAEGNYDRCYMPIKFKKGVELENMSKIKINDAFITFNQWTDKDGKIVKVPCVMVMDYSQDSQMVKEEKKSDPFTEFGQELSEDEFPF